MFLRFEIELAPAAQPQRRGSNPAREKQFDYWLQFSDALK